MNYAYFCTTLHQSFIKHVLPFIMCHVKPIQQSFIKYCYKRKTLPHE